MIRKGKWNFWVLHKIIILSSEKMDIKNKVTEVVEKVAKKEIATKATPTEIIVDKEKKAVNDKKSIVVEPLLVEEKITGTLIS